MLGPNWKGLPLYAYGVPKVGSGQNKALNQDCALEMTRNDHFRLRQNCGVPVPRLEALRLENLKISDRHRSEFEWGRLSFIHHWECFHCLLMLNVSVGSLFEPSTR